MASTPIVQDMDDLYETPSNNATPALQTASAPNYLDAQQQQQLPTTQPQAQIPAISGIPGLGMFGAASVSSTSKPQQGVQQSVEDAQTEIVQTSDARQDAAPVSALDHLPDAPTEASTATEQTATVHPSQPAPVASQSAPRDATSALFDALSNHDSASNPDKVDALENNESMNNNLPPASDKPAPDPEFLEAAQAQKGNQGAEWQYDTSDAESSSDSSSDESSSDDEDSDEEGYELLDPATAVRMLMDEGGMDDEDGPARPSGNTQLRTKNEQPEEIIPKPDVTVTPDMTITPLGAVQHVVDNLILVKAFTTGEYQVLESGSVLCLDNREVIGAVQDTLGKVEEPLYSVAFTRPSDITDLNITEDTKIFYVNDHSTYVFTEPLKRMKGTDASNLHDEEVAADDMEFSDDEEEAAYKRAKKQAKKGARPAQQEFDQPPAAKPYTGGAISYDDEPETEDMYTPLARPDNLQQMMSNGPPTLPARRGFPDRGRGRGRGRGDRGRGDRGRGRGGRGGVDNSNQRRGPANSYPDSHNTHNNLQPSIPQKPNPQAWPQGQSQPNVPFAFPHFAQQQQQFPPPPPPPQAQSQYGGMPFAWPPNPQQFFNGNAQQQGFQYHAPPTPGGSIPAGAFVNPMFFQQMQQQQQQQQPQQYQQPAPSVTPAQQGSGPTPEAIQAAADIWRRLQQQQQQQQ